jgi:hypothetical protein
VGDEQPTGQRANQDAQRTRTTCHHHGHHPHEGWQEHRGNAVMNHAEPVCKLIVKPEGGEKK